MCVVCMYGNNMCVVAAKVALLTGFPGDGSSRIPDGKGQKKKKKKHMHMHMLYVGAILTHSSHTFYLGYYKG